LFLGLELTASVASFVYASHVCRQARWFSLASGETVSKLAILIVRGLDGEMSTPFLMLTFFNSITRRFDGMW
jgi:hypothetical protein